MAKARGKPKATNVVSFATFRETRKAVTAPQSTSQSHQTPEEMEQQTWSHARLAAWCLYWRGTENSIFELLTPWEERFMADMAIWIGAPTERQLACLNRIKDKIQRQLKALDEPNDAA